MKTSSLLVAALSLAALVPAAQAQIGWAVTIDNDLISFGLSAPGTALTSSAITGLRQVDGVSADPFGQILDLAQSNGQLYALDANANFYSLNSTSGTATFLSNALSPLGFDGGLAYDSFFGEFRFVSDVGENKLISSTGSVTNAPSLFYGAGDPGFGSTASFTGLAIDYDFGTGYALDSARNTLALTYDTNFAEFFTVGSLGLDITSLASMEILNDALYAALSTDASSSSLYSINSLTGTATLIGSFNSGITALAITPASAVPEPSTYAAFAGASALALALYRRRHPRRA